VRGGRSLTLDRRGCMCAVEHVCLRCGVVQVHSFCIRAALTMPAKPVSSSTHRQLLRVSALRLLSAASSGGRPGSTPPDRLSLCTKMKGLDCCENGMLPRSPAARAGLRMAGRLAGWL
jgi:hypothetical protein